MSEEKQREIPFADVEVGKQYQYEEKYYLAATVTVLSKGEEESNADEGYAYLAFRLRIDKVIFGHVKVGDEFIIGGTTNPKLQHYVSSKFKPVGSPTDYVVVASEGGAHKDGNG